MAELMAQPDPVSQAAGQRFRVSVLPEPATDARMS